ncbi:MAG: hypothetical protein WC909_01995 [Candidatus Paceibacterota bacterium]|jgi:mannose-6-phosphate isomerase-like protein (cupin superfamily)
MKFEFNKTLKFGWKGLKGWSYNSSADFPRASAAYFEVTGNHGRVKSKKSDRIYFVVDGRGEFMIKDKTISVKKKDVIIVPRNTDYDYKAKNGIMKLFLTHSPAYNEKEEVKYEDF